MADCQHVTKLHEAFTEQDDLHILTELCAGGTLADKVAMEGPLPKATAAKFLEALAHFANDCAKQGMAYWYSFAPRYFRPDSVQNRLPEARMPGFVTKTWSVELEHHFYTFLPFNSKLCSVKYNKTCMSEIWVGVMNNRQQILHQRQAN